MASVTQTYACIGSAFANGQSQGENNHTAASYEMIHQASSSYKNRLFLRFEAFPRSLHRRVLSNAYVTEYWSLQTSTGSGTSTGKICATEAFDETTLTYANQPKQLAYVGTSPLINSQYNPSPNPQQFPVTQSSSSTSGDLAKQILKASCVYIECSGNSSFNYLYLNTRRASSKPYLTVVYDTRDVEYQLKGLLYTSGSINRFRDLTFKWSTVKAVSEEYCMADPVQVSAVFHWRAGTSGAFNEIPVAGSTQELTVPANTFPSTDTLQWYVTGVDDYGVALNYKEIYTVSTKVGELRAVPSSPINGAFADPLGGTQFMWTLQNSSGIYLQTSADLQWSADGTTWSNLGSVEGDSQTFVSPAGIFNVGTYYWRVRAWNADGEAGPWSSAATFSTVDSPMSAIPEHPVSEVCEINRPITFSWGYSSDTGTVPERSDLQYSRDANEWTDLATVTGRVFTYTVPADFFLAGTVYWRARAYNHNNVVGDWSAAVSFIAFGAPNPPSVSVDAVPFAVISWQVSGQEAYKVTVDGVEYGAYFGSAKSFEVPEPLEPGRHSASVVVQGQYGLWSPAGEIVFDVTNVPGASVDLTGSFGRDAALSWSCADETADFLIYRDDVLIGHTSGNSFTDRAALGYHSYSVLNRLPGGYYTASNAVSGTMRVDCLALAPLRGGAWVDLALSENSDDAVTYTETQQVSLRQFAGRDYPTAERSRYKTRVARFNAAWEHESADALAFEAMLGELVIYKHRDGRCFVGVLSAFELASKKFYKAYAASVQQSTWKEYTDADS